LTCVGSKFFLDVQAVFLQQELEVFPRTSFNVQASITGSILVNPSGLLWSSAFEKLAVLRESLVA
jgi:hypothetical protein